MFEAVLTGKKQQKSTISLMKSNLPTNDYDEK